MGNCGFLTHPPVVVLVWWAIQELPGAGDKSGIDWQGKGT